MKNYDEMADSILKRRDAYFEKRSGRHEYPYV